jgi:putative phosphoribosyl transferase
MNRVFRNRSEAGQILAGELAEYTGRGDVIVLALPRGGVPVGFEVARRLNAPLDVFLVRKLGVPWHPELAMGAIADGGTQVLNQEVISAYGISAGAIQEVAWREERELQRRARHYRGERPFPDVKGLTVILVDDGAATGSTLRAALAAVRNLGPAFLVAAVPVAPPEVCEKLRQEADRMVCLETPESFEAVGAWYEDFSQITDEEVRERLSRASLNDVKGAAP